MHDWPFVSVIIPVHNDPYGIQQTLRSLFRQDYPKKQYEIIVVDNNSNDDTISMIQKTVSEFEGNVIVETEEMQGSYAARNKGFSVSRGEIIAFIDSDMTVGSDWIYKGVQCFTNKKKDYVGCNIEIYSSKKIPSLWEKYDIILGFPIKNYMKIDGYAPTACLFVARNVIEKAGNFDSRLLSGGDCEFGNRARSHGFKMYFDQDNIMYHPARNSFSSLFQKQKRVTPGQIRLRRLFPERFPHNRFKDVAICCIHLFPVASPAVLFKLSRSRVDFFPLFGIFYALRLYTCWFKFANKCFF